MMRAAKLAMDMRLRPFEAAKAMRRLFKKPGETRQVFILLRALRGRSGLRSFRRFAASATGAAVLRERRSLFAALRDRAALGQLPPGTLGHAYQEFMEGQNLSAEDLMQASQVWEQEVLPPDAMLYRDRMLAAHDLAHVLTGYGRDPLGEYCLLAFMYAHTRNIGMVTIVAMRWPRLSSAARRAVAEAWRNGRKARWLPEQDFEALLPRSLKAARHELGIADPVCYRAIAP
jgi:ubiquinone biosynthesis protein COQ4